MVLFTINLLFSIIVNSSFTSLSLIVSILFLILSKFDVLLVNNSLIISIIDDIIFIFFSLNKYTHNNSIILFNFLSYLTVSHISILSVNWNNISSINPYNENEKI